MGFQASSMLYFRPVPLVEDKKMNAITESECRELAGLLGIEWNSDKCLFCGKSENDGFHAKYGNDYEAGKHDFQGSADELNPNFLDPIVVLEYVERMDDFEQFIGTLEINVSIVTYTKHFQKILNSLVASVLRRYFLNTTGLFAKKLYDWMKERGNENSN